MRPQHPVSGAVVLFGALLVQCVFGVSTSDQAEGDLICPPDTPAECYPRIFQATTEFQKVREGQDLPPGLHVRMDIWTGEKEAKLNDPDEQDPALEGLPVDRAVMLVESASADDAAPLPSGAPLYEPAGLVKAPSNESQAFYDALAVVKEGLAPQKTGLSSAGGIDATHPLDEPLEVLEELAHDIYYGVKVAQDRETLKALLCLMSSRDVFDAGADESLVGQARQAAAIVAASVQNNPTALGHVEEAWPAFFQTKCPSSAGQSVDLGRLIFDSFLGPCFTQEENPAGQPCAGQCTALGHQRTAEERPHQAGLSGRRRHGPRARPARRGRA